MKVLSLQTILVRRCISMALVVGILLAPSLVSAAASLTVSPYSGLTNGQTVKVSGSGLADNSTGAILECNGDQSQPTVTVAGNQVPVSCTNPLSNIVTTTSSGNLPSSSFVVHTGTVGPPGTGSDSSGGNAATDAQSYPCPPTTAEIAAGDSCDITFGDANNDDVLQNILFANQSSSGSTSNSGTTNSGLSSSTSKSNTAAPPSGLVNTGSGNVISLFVATVIFGCVAYYCYLYLRPAKNTR